MTSFIVTSDWHVGAPMLSARSAAVSFREVRFEVISDIVQLAKKRKVKAVFILGDLFDSDRVGEPDILRVGVLLSKTKCPVYIMPGNHDWWHKGGVMAAFGRLSKKHGNVHIILEEASITVEGLESVTFYPSPLTRKNPIKDMSEWIPERTPEDGIRVGLLHGSIDTVPDGTIPRNVSELRDLDLTFLGDWHGPTELDKSTYYCGSPDPGGFDEQHEGQVLYVEVEETGVNVEPIVVGRLSWQPIELVLEPEELGGMGCKSLVQALNEVTSSPERTAIRLHLSGSLSWDELNELDQCLTELQYGGWGSVDDDDIRVEPFSDVDISVLPDAIQAVARKILDSDSDEVVKRRALVILNNTLEAIQ